MGSGIQARDAMTELEKRVPLWLIAFDPTEQIGPDPLYDGCPRLSATTPHMPDSLPLLDLAIIALYLLGTTVFGVWFVRRSGTLEGFVLGGRALPGWAVGLSILGTYLSSISFLANPGKSYASDWRPFVFSLTLPLACWAAVRWFVPLYRQRIQTTAYEHLEQRFGYWARAYAGISLILLQVGRVAVVLYLVALAMSELLGWEVRVVILGLGLLTLLYTAVGGFAAVVWTDVVQAVVLLTGALLCVGLLLVQIPGGGETIARVASEHHKLGLGGFDPDLLQQGFWVIFLFGLVENLRNFGIDQNYVQRFLSARSDRDALRSLWLGGLLYIPVSALFFLIGTLLFVYYQTLPDPALPAKPDQVFPYFIVHQIPSGLTGILIAAILAAGMSTLDSSLNSSATVWVLDFYRRHLRPGADERRLLGVTRLATVAVGLVGTIASLAMVHARTALDVWWQISAVFGGGMLGLFLLGLLVPRADGRAALAATTLGIAVTAWASMDDASAAWPAFPLNTMLVGLAGTLTILFGGWLLSLGGRRPARC
jgi:SSS family solute:Na+ symporter